MPFTPSAAADLRSDGVKRWPVERHVVFDNGPSMKRSSAASVVPPYMNADDFFLGSSTRITGFEWNVAEVPLFGQALTYVNTSISVLAASADGTPGAMLFKADVAAARTVWAPATGPSGFNSVRFNASGLALELGSGTYFLAITQHYADPMSTAFFVQAAGSRPAGARDGSYFSTPTTAGGWLAYPEDNSFRVFGSQLVSAVPEPNSFLLAMIGSLLVAGVQARTTRTNEAEPKSCSSGDCLPSCHPLPSRLDSPMLAAERSCAHPV